MDASRQNLSEFMHDAGLEGLSSDVSARTVVVVVESPDLASYYDLPDTERLMLRMEEVTAVRCAVVTDSGREESVAWARAETMGREQDGIVYDAALESDGDRITLHLILFTGPDELPFGPSREWHIEITGARLRLFLTEADREITLKTALLEDEAPP